MGLLILTIRAKDLTLPDGVIDQFDTPDSTAMGLALQNVNFAFMLMRTTTAPRVKYYAIKATANYAGLVGIDSFKLSAAGLDIAYNTVSNPNNSADTTVVDFKKSFPAINSVPAGYAVDTGNGTVNLDYTGKLLRASIATADLEIESYVSIHGGLFFEKGGTEAVHMVGDTSSTPATTMSVLKVGAENLSMFFGANGPYLSDTNGDGLINSSDTVNPDAVGVSVTNAKLAMALFKPVSGAIKYLGLKATADHVGFVGTDVFALSATSVVIELNLATGADATPTSPVVNFSLFPTGGYTVPTGSGSSLKLDFASKRIHASADNVLVKISDFVYLNGNVAFDLGSRELVTISTGVPSALGNLLHDQVSQVQGFLTGLTNTLMSVRQQVESQITAAINAVKTSISAQVDSIVTTIFNTIQSQVQSALTTAKATVTASVTSALNTATTGFSVGSIIDGIINPLVNSAISEGPIRDLVKILVSPIKSLLSAAFGDMLKDVVSGPLDDIVGSIGAAVDAGLLRAQAQALTKIHAVLDPKIDLIVAKLNALQTKAYAKLGPIFDKLNALANIRVGENFGTLTGVTVDVTAVGISNAYLFVGLGPYFVDNHNQSGQAVPDGVIDSHDIPNSKAIGLVVENFNMGLALFKPVLSKQLPSFTALKLSADRMFLKLGDPSDILLSAKDINVALNLGGPVVQGSGAVLGNAAIDFRASFPVTAAHTTLGYAVQTGTNSAPIYLDFEGHEIIRASVSDAILKIFGFVYVTGNFAFDKGTIQTVNVTGGLSSGAASAFLSALGISGDVGIPATGASTTQLSFMTVGASDVHAFVGMHGPYWAIGDTLTVSGAAGTYTISDGTNQYFGDRRRRLGRRYSDRARRAGQHWPG